MTTRTRLRHVKEDGSGGIRCFLDQGTFSVQGPEAAHRQQAPKLRYLQEPLSFLIRSRIDQNRHCKGHFCALMRAAGQKPTPGPPPVMALARAKVADESVVVFIGFPHQSGDKLAPRVVSAVSLRRRLNTPLPRPPPHLWSRVNSHFLSGFISRRSAAFSQEFLGVEPFSEEPPPDLRFITLRL